MIRDIHLYGFPEKRIPDFPWPIKWRMTVPDILAPLALSVDWKTGRAVITEEDKVVWKGENLNFLAQKAQQIVIRRVINA